MDTFYIVRHKNPNNPATKGGAVWAIDGEGEKWTKAAAEEHARRCDYGVSNIPYEVVPLSKPEKVTADEKEKK